MGLLSYHQFNSYCHCHSTPIVTNGSIYLPFKRPTRTNHITKTLYVSWNYNCIHRFQSYHKFNCQCHCYSTPIVTNGSICLTFKRPNLTNYITITLQSPGTIISSSGPMGLLISSILGSIHSYSPNSFTFHHTTKGN